MIVLVFILAIAARIFISEFSHEMFWDELMYHQEAYQIAQGLGYNFDDRIPGWPYLIMMFNSVFDLKNQAGIILNVILGSLTVSLNFLLARRFGLPKWALVFHVILWVFSWEHVRWSQAAEANISSLFLVSSFWLLCLQYVGNPNSRNSFYLVIAATLAGFIRIENFVLIPIAYFVFWLERKQFPFYKTLVYALIPAAVLKLALKSLFFIPTQIGQPLSRLGLNKPITYLFRISLIIFKSSVFHSWICLRCFGFHLC